jgi:hypothetical protein
MTRTRVARNYDPKPPEGMAYQWIVTHVYDQPRCDTWTVDGWVPVPADRHPDLGRVIGAVLMERPIGLVDDELDRLASIALEKQGTFIATGRDHCPPGFVAHFFPGDLPFTLTETGWRPTEEVHDAEEGKE